MHSVDEHADKKPVSPEPGRPADGPAWLERRWRSYRALPLWLLAPTAVLLWPLVTAFWLWRRPAAWPGASRQRFVAGLLVALITPTWFATLSAAGQPQDLKPTSEVAAAQRAAVGSKANTSEPEPDPVSSKATATPEETGPSRPEGAPRDTQPATVLRVVDGDTFDVRVDEPSELPDALPEGQHTVRLLEIDTPETADPGEPVGCGGPEATAFARQHLKVGSLVWLQADQESHDRYGRALRYAWTANGLFFNAAAVRQGFALAVLYEPNDAHISMLRSAEQDARKAGRELWGPPCDIDAPPPTAEPPTGPAAAPQPPPAPIAQPATPAPAPARHPRPAPPAAPAAPAPPPSGSGTASYANCDAARAAGVAPLHQGEPGYSSKLDRDGDGIACE